MQDGCCLIAQTTLLMGLNEALQGTCQDTMHSLAQLWGHARLKVDPLTASEMSHCSRQ